jgi:hypothetical protein
MNIAVEKQFFYEHCGTETDGFFYENYSTERGGFFNEYYSNQTGGLDLRTLQY